MISPPWPNEREAELERLWAEGHSASEIGRRLGISRNAVLGKAHRRGLPSRRARVRVYQPAKAKAIRRAKLKPVPKPKVTRMLPTPVPDEPVSLDITLMDLRSGQCRWAHGDGPFLFCGHRTFDGSSYCEHHAARSIQPRIPTGKPFVLLPRRQAA